MKNKKKILNVVSVYFSISYFLGNQLKYFKEKGHDIYLVCSPSDEIVGLADRQGIKYKEFLILRKFSIIQDLITTFLLYRYIKKHNFNIVSGHSPKGALIAMISSYMAGTKMRIYFRHGLVYETSSGLKRKLLILLEKFTARLAHKVVCASPSILIETEINNLNSSKKNIVLGKGTCNGIDVLRFYKTENKQPGKKTFTIGFVGRLVKDKGIVELVEAWKLLIAEFENINLLLVGPFEERDSLPLEIMNFITDEKSIIYTGLVADTVPYYSEMDAYILPSYREGFPTSVLEASSMKLPVITTRSTGCIDAIIPNETGIYTELNKKDIARAIKFYIKKPELAVKHGENGRDFVVRNFKQEVIWGFIEKDLYG